MVSEAKKRANKKWDKANYERLQTTVPIGFNEAIEKAAKEQGYPSKRAFIIYAITRAIVIDAIIRDAEKVIYGGKDNV